MPPAYIGRMLQYRLVQSSCSWRVWTERNTSHGTANVYSLETHLYELLLQSPHRTLDAAEADFFYVPLLTSCFAWCAAGLPAAHVHFRGGRGDARRLPPARPSCRLLTTTATSLPRRSPPPPPRRPIFGWADAPWWGGTFPRVQHMSGMALEAKRWLQAAFPYWNRTGGRDHVFLFSHDEGACWAPTEVYENAIILTHWGRRGIEHRRAGRLAARSRRHRAALDRCAPPPQDLPTPLACSIHP